MGLVKCIDTGEKINKSEAYIAQVLVNHRDGSTSYKNVFYSSEDAYKKDVAEKEMCRKCSDFMFFTILGYESGHDMNTSFYKRLQKWRKAYSYEVIYTTMLTMYNKAHDFVERTISFDSETQRINYWGSAIENNLEDTYITMKKNSRENIIITDDIENIDADITFVPKKKIDISKFLED